MVKITLPTEHAAELTQSLKTAGDFKVIEHADGHLEVEPAEGAGAVRSYFGARKAADATTDVGQDAVWAFLSVNPPISPKPEMNLPNDAVSQFTELTRSNSGPFVSSG